MRQKILIAAAVLHNPRIVVLDEPFSGLDVSAARVLKAFVRALADDGKMVVFSSHVLEVVEQVCSRVVILKDGRSSATIRSRNLRATLHCRPSTPCSRRSSRRTTSRSGLRGDGRRDDKP